MTGCDMVNNVLLLSAKRRIAENCPQYFQRTRSVIRYRLTVSYI